MKREFEIYTDGASRGNPGLAAIGVVIKEHGEVIRELSKTIGKATNNVAEYMSLIFALQEALILKGNHLKLNTDSELLYNQLIGNYKVKNENIKTLFLQAQHLLEAFDKIEIKRVPREQNREADRLANQAIKKEQTKVVAFSSYGEGEESPSSRG